MEKSVRIQSKQTITVTPGLQHDDFTDKKALIPDKLKVAATWCKATVLIREGAGTYPAEIAEWDSVKALEKDGILTIGQIVEDEAIEEEAKTLNKKLTAIGATGTTGKRKKLEEIAE